MESKKDTKKEPELRPETEKKNEQYKYKSQKQMEQLRTYVYQNEGKDYK